MPATARFLLLLLFSFGSLAAAEGQVRFEASTNAKQVVEGSYFDITFTLYDGSGTQFTPPEFSDFVVISGPNRAVSTSMINGKVNREMSLSYTLQPRRKGTFTIGPATIKAGGVTLETEPLTVEVVEARDGQLRDEQKAYIQAEVSSTEAYVGQQLTLNYKLYTTVDVESFNILQEGSYQGFFAVDVRRFNGRIMQEVINGVQYTTKVLKQVALYPQQTGQLTISPMNVQLGVVESNGNRPRSFFFNREVRRVPANTKPVTVNVKPLPSGAPASFTGAVGEYRMRASVTPKKVAADNAVTVLLTIQGDGDIKRVQAPPINVPEDFELYDPKVMEESTLENGQGITGKRVFEYLLLPKQAGTYTLQPSFTYFSPDSAKYVTLDSRPYSLEVGPNDGTSASIPPEASASSGQTDQLSPLRLEPSLHKKRGPFLGSVPFWGVVTTPFLLLLGAIGLRAWRRKRAQVDPAQTKMQKAQRLVKERLSKATQHLQNAEGRAFYDEVSKAVQVYICDKLQMPRSALNKDQVRQHLRSLELPEVLIERLLQLMQTCEMALFAGKTGDQSAMEQTYKEAKAVLEETERALR